MDKLMYAVMAYLGLCFVYYLVYFALWGVGKAFNATYDWLSWRSLRRSGWTR